MKFNHFLRLSGYAYLHEVVQVGDQTIARLKAATHFNLTSQGEDDIWIDAEVNDLLTMSRLYALLPSTSDDESVLITFEAEYSLFVNLHSGQTPDDPDQIITLRAKLLDLGNCYINGCLIGEKTLLRAVA